MNTSQKKPGVPSGRSNRKPPARKTQDLISDALALRIEFVRVDLEIAATFVSLARFDLKKGETDHAARLLVLAHKAAEVISGMLQNVATADATPLRARLRLLEDSIREAHATPKAPAA